MFLDEARLAARIRHPNVASTLDVVARKRELFLVMEYIHGESFSRMTREAAKRDAYIPVEMVVSVLHGVVQGLHAAHEAKGENGEPLAIVHRDVSPQNIMLGSDGIARVLDFGVAKAIGRLQTTLDGQLKGKPAYMAPEQLRGRPIDRRTDVYAAGVVLWEALAGVRLFQADSPGETMARVLEMPVEAPSHSAVDRTDRIPSSLDAVALKALSRDAGARYGTALEMAMALEQAGVPIPNAREVGDYMRSTVGASLAKRASRVHEIESAGSSGVDASGVRPSDTEAAEPDTDRLDHELSTISGQSSSGGVVPGRVSHSRWGMLATGAAIPVVAAGLIYLARTPSSAPAPISTATPPPHGAAGPSPLAPAMVTDLPSSPPAVASSGLGTSSGVGSDEPAATKPHTERGRRPRSTPASAPPKGPTGGNTACNPPYTVDADGVHIPKPACE
jgi:serine/threonine-protein kinase